MSAGMKYIEPFPPATIVWQHELTYFRRDTGNISLINKTLEKDEISLIISVDIRASHKSQSGKWIKPKSLNFSQNGL